MKRLFNSFLGVTAVWLLLASQGCGTIVGNPKKPTSPQPSLGETPIPVAEPAGADPIASVRLPSISLDLVDLTLEESVSGLSLMGDGDFFETEDSLINGWAKRLEKIIDTTNDLSQVVNQALDADGPEVSGKRAKLKRKGQDQRVSAVIKRMGSEGSANYESYEASVCFGGRLAAQLQWNADQSKISWTRDLSAKARQADEEMPLLTSFVLEKTSVGYAFTLKSSGSWNAYSPARRDGPRFVDYSEGVIYQNRMIELKSVADYFEEVPADLKFEADTYIVGRIHPTGVKGKGGKLRAQKEFVGYHKGFNQTICKSGFSEDSPTVWSPNLSEPRFCLGRPVGAPRFKSVAVFLDTLASLKSIGIAKRDSLAIPKFNEASSCDE